MPSREDTDYFMNGECPSFALALHYTFGYSLFAGKYEYNIGNGVTHHFFCMNADIHRGMRRAIREGMMVDVRGVTPMLSCLKITDEYKDECDVDSLRHFQSEANINRALDIIEVAPEKYRCWGGPVIQKVDEAMDTMCSCSPTSPTDYYALHQYRD